VGAIMVGYYAKRKAQKTKSTKAKRAAEAARFRDATL